MTTKSHLSHLLFFFCLLTLSFGLEIENQDELEKTWYKTHEPFDSYLLSQFFKRHNQMKDYDLWLTRSSDAGFTPAQIEKAKNLVSSGKIDQLREAHTILLILNKKQIVGKDKDNLVFLSHELALKESTLGLFVSSVTTPVSSDELDSLIKKWKGQRDAHSAYELSILYSVYKGDEQTGLVWLTRAADGGDVNALYTLGCILSNEKGKWTRSDQSRATQVIASIEGTHKQEFLKHFGLETLNRLVSDLNIRLLEAPNSTPIISNVD